MMNFPAPATPGQIYTPPGGPSYRYDDPIWNMVGTVAEGGGGGGGGGAATTTSDDPPVDPEDGQLWWNSTDGNLYVWYEDLDSGQWVQSNATTVPSGTPIAVTTRAAMLALDGTLTLALFDGSQWLWVGYDLSATLLGPTIASSAVNSSTDIVTSVAHGLTKNDPVVALSAVNGLALNTVYYAIEVDADTFQLATTRDNSAAGTAFNLTGTTAFSVRKHLDPDQYIYVTPTATISGAAGAWKRQDGEALGRGWLNMSPTGNFRRLGDHVLAGKGAVYWNGRTKGGGGFGSWLFAEGEGSVRMNYLLVNSVISGVSDNVSGLDSPYGVFGASRTPFGATSNAAIGVSGFAKGNGTSGSSVAWASYFDAVKGPTSNTLTMAMELEVTNLNPTPVASQNPYAGFVAGRTYGLAVGSGADPTVHPASYDANVALLVFNNGARFEQGLVIKHDSLMVTGIGTQHAIVLPSAGNIEWWKWDGSDPASAVSSVAVRGNVQTLSHAQTLEFSDAGMFLYNADAKRMFGVVSQTSTVNYIDLLPTVTTAMPELRAQGDDANIDIYIRGKGTSGGRLLSTAGGTTALWWGPSTIGFLGGAPITRRTMAAATGTATRTTFDTTTVTLPQLAERVKALIDDFRLYGLHG